MRSENMVLWMLYMWAYTGMGLHRKVPRIQGAAAAALSARVRVSQLTPTYLMAALQTDWFQPRDKLINLAGLHMSGMLPQLSRSVKSDVDACWPTAWTSSTPRTAIPPQVHLDWNVPAEQVAQLFTDAKALPLSKASPIKKSSVVLVGAVELFRARITQ